MTNRSRSPHFGRALFAFLTDLKANNDREWFRANKDRYVSEVERPMLSFIADIGDRLARVSASFVADPRPGGGSMFRIYRDTRFSKDKTPFKLAAGAQFPHRARGDGRSVPGFYLHLEPARSLGGGGIYHPDAAALRRIRRRILDRPREWEAVLQTGIRITGDALRRPPRGYDADHRFVQDLKRKDLYSMVRFTEREVCAPDFITTYLDACRRSAALVAFLTRALGLRW